jgi:hypothetical protein
MYLMTITACSNIRVVIQIVLVPDKGIVVTIPAYSALPVFEQLFVVAGMRCMAACAAVSVPVH